jgi:4-carboxymuconolactone decarboxylase
VSEQEGRRAAGMAKMQEVYGFTVDPADLPGRYIDVTVDHLFGTIWTDDTIELRDRRILSWRHRTSRNSWKSSSKTHSGAAS